MLTTSNMKIIASLFCVIAVCAAGVLDQSLWQYKEGDRYFYYTEDDGTITLVDTEEEIDQDFIDNYKDTDNGFHLYTKQNPTTHQPLFIEDEESVINSNFDPKKITVLYSHGWNSGPMGTTSNTTRDAFLASEDVNIILLDWEDMAGRNYITAKNGVAKVGKALGAFLMWMTTQGLEYERTHLIGHSLGAHLVGSTGRSVGGRVKRITGLDPAGPLYGGDNERLNRTDAQYVEVIHTNTAVLGYGDPLGHADFYPNGGAIMPGCFIVNIICSHRRAPAYMASSVKYNNMKANECRSINDMHRDRCNGQEYLMGNNDLNKFGVGIFRLNTDRDYPYDPTD